MSYGDRIPIQNVTAEAKKSTKNVVKNKTVKEQRNSY